MTWVDQNTINYVTSMLEAIPMSAWLVVIVLGAVFALISFAKK